MEKEEESEKQANISLILDTYDDIFSDFDPRPYSERAMSDDFLNEMRNASRDKPSGGIELTLSMPADKRNLTKEGLIKRRLIEHFKKHHLEMQREYKRIRNKGITLAAIGISMITAASYLASLKLESFWFHFLIILLEPGGWFLGWTGLDQLYYTIEEHKKDMRFYDKMTRCEITFVSH